LKNTASYDSEYVIIQKTLTDVGMMMG